MSPCSWPPECHVWVQPQIFFPRLARSNICTQLLKLWRGPSKSAAIFAPFDRDFRLALTIINRYVSLQNWVVDAILLATIVHFSWICDTLTLWPWPNFTFCVAEFTSAFRRLLLAMRNVVRCRARAVHDNNDTTTTMTLSPSLSPISSPYLYKTFLLSFAVFLVATSTDWKYTGGLWWLAGSKDACLIIFNSS